MEIGFEHIAFGLMVVFLLFGLIDPVSFLIAAIMLVLALLFRKREQERRESEEKVKKKKRD